MARTSCPRLILLSSFSVTWWEIAARQLLRQQALTAQTGNRVSGCGGMLLQWRLSNHIR